MTFGTLYSDGSLCPYTHRVLIASHELGTPIDTVFGGAIPEAVRKANTDGTWPAFAPAGGDAILKESNQIVEHLIGRSGARGAAYRSNSDDLARLDALPVCIAKVLLAGKPTMQSEFRERLDLALAEVERMLALSGGPYLGGDHFSQADGHVVPWIYRLPFVVEIRDHVPRAFLANTELAAWADRVVNRESFRKIAPERHVLRKFYAAKATYGKPMKVARLHHSAFRGMWADLVARTAALAKGDDLDNRALQEARDLCYLLFRAVSLHATVENLVVFPALDAARNDTQFTAEVLAQHDHEEGAMNSFLEHFDRALGEPVGARADTLASLAATSVPLRESQLAHFDLEERNFLPVLAELEVEQHMAMLASSYALCILERPHLIGVLASYMPIENVLSLLDSLLNAVTPESEQWRTLLWAMHRYLDAERWLRVVRRFEDVLPLSLMVIPSSHRRGTIGDAARALSAAAPIERLSIPHSPAQATEGR
jgi:glutathione S-transferase